MTVEPLKFGPDAKVAPDGVSASEVASRCTGFPGVDADPGNPLSLGLIAHYSCETATDTTLPDVSGNNRNATIVASSAGDAGFRFATGKVGKALFLVSTSNAHVVLPPGMLANACEATVATWVYLNTQKAWQRVWTLGNGGSNYMYLTTSRSSTGLPRSSITLTNNPGDDTESVEGRSALPAGAWIHLAVVLGPAGLVLYVDGIQADASPASILRPVDLGKTLYDYIGRSNNTWDPYLDGAIDEFRIYNRALSSAEIRALANPS